MEKRQLDLSKPLLSVRRIPKLGYRSALSGEIVQRPPSEFRLPPRLTLKSDGNEMEQVTKPAAVPFIWEHTPGRAKSKSGPLYFAREEQLHQASISPRYPPGRVSERAMLQGQIQKKEFDGIYVQKAKTFAPSPIVRANTTFERSDVRASEKECGLNLDDVNDEFTDALDTLFHEDTSSMSCSVSGISGDEGDSNTGKFSVDRQTQDFLMSRFLPAAKAMALESPQYAVKKQPAAAEEPKIVKRLSNAERRPQLKQYESRVVHYVDKSVGNDQSESESEDESCDTTPSNVSVRACGFLPKFCLKNSLAIINQITDTKGRSQSPKVSRNEVKKVAKPPSPRPATPTHIPDKYAWEASYKRILERKAEQRKAADATIDKQIEEYVKRNASQEANRVSPHRNSVRGNISPYRNQRPPSPFREGVGFLGIPQEAEKSKDSLNNLASSKFHDVLPHIEKESPAVEKTVYVDFVTPVKKSNYYSDEVVKREVMPIEPVKRKTIGPESIPYVMKRLKEFSFSKREAAESFVASRPSLSAVSSMKDHKQLELLCDQKPSSLLKASAEKDLSVIKKQSAKDDQVANLELVASPLPPPLPKLPSESWLWRTLPSIPSKNPFSGLKKSSSRPSSPSAKWETIVKTSKLQKDHRRYSEELSTPVSKLHRK